MSGLLQMWMNYLRYGIVKTKTPVVDTLERRRIEITLRYIIR
jgi:hypothetical protein